MHVSRSSINLSSRGLSTIQSAAFGTHPRRHYRTHVMAVYVDPPPCPSVPEHARLQIAETTPLLRLATAPPLPGGSTSTLPVKSGPIACNGRFPTWRL